MSKARTEKTTITLRGKVVEEFEYATNRQWFSHIKRIMKKYPETDWTIMQETTHWNDEANHITTGDFAGSVQAMRIWESGFRG